MPKRSPFFAEHVGQHSKTREDIKTWFDTNDLVDYVTFGGKAQQTLNAERRTLNAERRRARERARLKGEGPEGPPDTDTAQPGPAGPQKLIPTPPVMALES